MCRSNGNSFCFAANLRWIRRMMAWHEVGDETREEEPRFPPLGHGSDRRGMTGRGRAADPTTVSHRDRDGREGLGSALEILPRRLPVGTITRDRQGERRLVPSFGCPGLHLPRWFVDVALPRPDRTDEHHFGTSFLCSVVHRDRVLVNVQSDAERGSFSHGCPLGCTAGLRPSMRLCPLRGLPAITLKVSRERSRKSCYLGACDAAWA